MATALRTICRETALIVEITHYHARPGQADAVLEQRQHATTLRVRLGLAPGRIFRKLEGAGPDVRWECSYATREDYERDMAARAGSKDFAAARQTMHGLLDRFERHLQQDVGDTPAGMPVPPAEQG
ncbi:MAG: hypothetical protein ABI156_15735 [Caldimonas sp.]